MFAPMKYSDELIDTLRNTCLKGMPEYLMLNPFLYIEKHTLKLI